MDIHHPYAEFGRSRHRAGRGIGDIVKLKVKEHLKPALVQIANKLRAQQGEHLFAHLQAAVSRVDAVDKCQRFIAIIIVERNHNGRGCDSAGRCDSCRRHDQTLVLMGARAAQKR